MLELCVLSVVSREDTYGYKLIQTIAQPLGLSESTLYPILRRLNKSGDLDVYDRNFDGRNRRYYHLSEKGEIHLRQLRSEWETFCKIMNELIQEDTEDIQEELYERDE